MTYREEAQTLLEIDEWQLAALLNVTHRSLVSGDFRRSKLRYLLMLLRALADEGVIGKAAYNAINEPIEEQNGNSLIGMIVDGAHYQIVWTAFKYRKENSQ